MSNNEHQEKRNRVGWRVGPWSKLSCRFLRNVHEGIIGTKIPRWEQPWPVHDKAGRTLYAE